MSEFQIGDRVRVVQHVPLWETELYTQLRGRVGRICACLDEGLDEQGDLYIVEFPERPVLPETGDEVRPLPKNAFGESRYTADGLVYAVTNLWFASELTRLVDDDNQPDE